MVLLLGFVLMMTTPGAMPSQALTTELPGNIHSAANNLLSNVLPAAPKTTVKVVGSNNYLYVHEPTISRDKYVEVICSYSSNNPVCPEAAAIYDFLVDEGFDPVLALAHAMKETEFGTTGIGRPGSAPMDARSLYGADCNSDADWCDSNGRKQSAFHSYLNATRAWVKMMRRTYIGRGLTTPAQVLPVYCPPIECNTQGYVDTMQGWIDDWRR